MLGRLLKRLDEPWGILKANSLIDESVLDEILKDPSTLKPVHTTRLLAALMNLRKEQARRLNDRIQRVLEILTKDEGQGMTWAKFLADMVQEQNGEVSGDLEQAASMLISNVPSSSLDYSERTLPREACLLHPSCLPQSFIEKANQKHSHFTVCKTVDFSVFEQDVSQSRTSGLRRPLSRSTIKLGRKRPSLKAGSSIRGSTSRLPPSKRPKHSSSMLKKVGLLRQHKGIKMLNMKEIATSQIEEKKRREEERAELKRAKMREKEEKKKVKEKERAERAREKAEKAKKKLEKAKLARELAIVKLAKEQKSAAEAAREPSASSQMNAILAKNRSQMEKLLASFPPTQALLSDPSSGGYGMHSASLLPQAVAEPIKNGDEEMGEQNQGV